MPDATDHDPEDNDVTSKLKKEQLPYTIQLYVVIDPKCQGKYFDE